MSYAPVRTRYLTDLILPKYPHNVHSTTCLGEEHTRNRYITTCPTRQQRHLFSSSLRTGVGPSQRCSHPGSRPRHAYL